MVETNLPALFLASFTTFFFVVLLAIVLIANTKSLLSRVFAIFLLNCVAWGLFAALEATKTTPAAEYLANIFLNDLGLFPTVFMYFFFCLIYLGKNWRPWLYYIIPSYLILAYFMTTDALTTVKQTPFTGGAGFHHRQQVGEFIPIAVLWGGTLLVSLAYYFIRDLIKRKDDKIHIKKVWLLIFATVPAALFTILYNSNPFFWAYPLDILGELITAVILTYAILRFELVDISTKLRNIIVDLIFTVILATLYVGLLVLLEFLFKLPTLNWATVILAIFVASLSQSFKERLLKLVDITFYRTRYDYRETVNGFAKKVGEILSLKELSASISSTIKDTFGAREVYLYIANGYYYHSLTRSASPFFAAHNNFIKYLKTKNSTLSWDENSKELETFEEIRSFPFELVIPLKSGEDLVGIIFIAKAVTGDFYTEDDKNLLYTLASSSAIALKNAILYEQVVTKSRDVERLLEHEREVSESKDQFVSIASHFLRTPLTTIKGFLYLLQNTKLAEEERINYINRATNEQKKLANLVEDIISISSLEKGQLKLYKEKAHLSDIIKKVIADYSSLATEKGLVLKESLKREITLEVDQQKITQAISNLVSNAIKFTAVGSVTIFVDAQGDQAQICVQDTGIGIEEAQVTQLFQKFHRGTSVRTYNYEGSGLGLYITKLIVDAHGGKITLNSKLGVGSSFCIYLPLHAGGNFHEF